MASAKITPTAEIYAQKENTSFRVNGTDSVNLKWRVIKLILPFFSVLLLVSMGAIFGLGWFILETEKRNDQYNSRFDALEERLAFPVQIDATTYVLENKTTIAIPSTTRSTSTKAKSKTDTTAVQKTTIRKTPSAAISSSTPSTTAATSGAFTLLQSNEITYAGYTFLAVQVEVPWDGLSRSENWCRDYQYLCESLGKRPTGCGEANMDSSGYALCRDEYNSDTNISNVLGCNPSTKIAEVTTDGFPDAQPPPTALTTAFGFHNCIAHCHKSIQASEWSLFKMSGFWKNNITTMYTVCR